jgi:hypothetical protein
MKTIQRCAVVLVTFGSLAASAHHSGAMYDSEKTVTISGTVREFQWTNPHSWLQVLANKREDGSGGEEWSIELAGPTVLAHRGWKPGTFKPGQKVTVTVHPMKNGTSAGSFASATLGDGTVINTGNGSGGAAPERY